MSEKTETVGSLVLSCRELMPFWPMYLDNELQDSDAQPYLKHLGACERCRGFIEGERRFRQVFRNKVRGQAAGAEQVSTRLREQVQAMAGSAPSRRRAPRLQWAFASGAFALLITVTFTTQSAFKPMLERVAQTHREALPLDVQTSDVDEAQRFIERHVPNVKIPAISTPNAHFAGARVLDLPGHRGVVLRYFVGPDLQPVSLVAYPADTNERVKTGHAVPAGRHRVFVDEVRGLPAVVWQARDVIYSMVGNVDRNELVELAAFAE